MPRRGSTQSRADEAVQRTLRTVGAIAVGAVGAMLALGGFVSSPGSVSWFQGGAGLGLLSAAAAIVRPVWMSRRGSKPRSRAECRTEQCKFTGRDRVMMERMDVALDAMRTLRQDDAVTWDAAEQVELRTRKLKMLLTVDAASQRLGGRRSHALRRETAAFIDALIALVDAAVDKQAAEMAGDTVLPVTLEELREALTAEAEAHDELATEIEPRGRRARPRRGSSPSA